MRVEVGFVDEVCTMETDGLRVFISTKLNLNDPFLIYMVFLIFAIVPNVNGRSNECRRLK